MMGSEKQMFQITEYYIWSYLFRGALDIFFTKYNSYYIIEWGEQKFGWLFSKYWRISEILQNIYVRKYFL